MKENISEKGVCTNETVARRKWLYMSMKRKVCMRHNRVKYVQPRKSDGLSKKRPEKDGGEGFGKGMGKEWIWTEGTKVCALKKKAREGCRWW